MRYFFYFKSILIGFYFIGTSFLFFIIRCPLVAINFLQKAEALNNNFIRYLSFTFFYFYKRAKRFDVDNRYRNRQLNRFSSAGQIKFLHHNVQVLKPFMNEKDKGIILIKYSEIINAFPFLFNINSLSKSFHFLLLPSTESPINPFNVLFRNLKSKVFITTHSNRERMEFERVGFILIDLTPGDFVDNAIFVKKNIPKIYDFIVIANFLKVKNYPLILKAVAKYGENLKGCIVSQAHFGLGLEWFKSKVKALNLDDNIAIFTDVSSEKICELLNESDSYVLGSYREGSNKALFEALLCGVPVVLYKHVIGPPVSRFPNSMVRYFTDLKSLVSSIIEFKNSNFNAWDKTGCDYANDYLYNVLYKEGIFFDKSTFLETVCRIHVFYLNKVERPIIDESLHIIEMSTANNFQFDVQLNFELLTSRIRD